MSEIKVIKSSMLNVPWVDEEKEKARLAELENKSKTISKAIEIAARYHGGQVDKLGNPYIYHCLKVMHKVAEFNDIDVTCAAVLHDVLEDTHCTVGDLLASGMSEETVRLVKILTRRVDETYVDYIWRVLESVKGREIKKADLATNLQGEIPESLRKRYKQALGILNTRDRRLKAKGNKDGKHSSNS